jgi:hypothetical protein
MDEEKDTKESKRAKEIKNARRALLRTVILIPLITIFSAGYQQSRALNRLILENTYKYSLPVLVISISLFLIIDFLEEARKSYQVGNKGKAKSLIIRGIVLLLPCALILINVIFPPSLWTMWERPTQIALLSVPIPLIYLLEKVKQALQAGNGGKSKSLIAGVITLLLILTISVWAVWGFPRISVWAVLGFPPTMLWWYSKPISVTIIFLYLIWDFLGEVSKFPSVMKIKKAKERMLDKLDVKIFLALIFAGISLWQLDTPPQGRIDPECEICQRLTRLEYNEMKKGIRGLITGKDVDIQFLESMVFPKDNTYRYNLCVTNRNRVGNERIYHCNSCMSTLYRFLQTAYKSVQNNEKTAARIALWRADIYLIFHPFCFNCDCNNVPIEPWDGTV